MPNEGYQMSELEASGHGERVEEHLVRLAERDGFPMLIPPFLPKTHLALTLAELARDDGDVAHLSMHHAVFGAYFGQGLDIGSREVLLDVAAAESYEASAVERAWDEGGYDDRLHQFRHLALHMGLESTPAALICSELLIGSRPYRVIKESLDRCLLTPDTIANEIEPAEE